MLGAISRGLFGTMRTIRLHKKRLRVAAVLLAISTALLAGPARAADTEPNAQALEALKQAFAAQDAKDWPSAKTLSANQPAVVRDLVQRRAELPDPQLWRRAVQRRVHR